MRASWRWRGTANDEHGSASIPVVGPRGRGTITFQCFYVNDPVGVSNPSVSQKSQSMSTTDNMTNQRSSVITTPTNGGSADAVGTWHFVRCEIVDLSTTHIGDRSSHSTGANSIPSDGDTVRRTAANIVAIPSQHDATHGGKVCKFEKTTDSSIDNSGGRVVEGTESDVSLRPNTFPVKTCVDVLANMWRRQTPDLRASTLSSDSSTNLSAKRSAYSVETSNSYPHQNVALSPAPR